jgi:bisphosphoglycerate-dependent phosphoglycerate mutase
MEVPTPPSIDDYTKVSYTFNDGAMTNTLISLLPKSGTNNEYVVNYVEEWQDDYAIVPGASSLVEKNGDTYSIGSCKLREAGVAPANISDDEYYESLSASQRSALLQNEAYLLKMVQEKTGDNGKFYIRYIKNTTNGNYEPYLYALSELQQTQKYNNKNLASIPCYSLGSTTQTREVLHKEATVEKDSSGRYVAITINLGTDDQGNKIERTYALTTTTTTDEEAYNDAMNEYNYKQHEYDHKIQEINSKLEIVQQQDKQLELKLKQLDTEENAISTEMDAVKKVISKNVESSFKTFNA